MILILTCMGSFLVVIPPHIGKIHGYPRVAYAVQQRGVIGTKKRGNFEIHFAINFFKKEKNIRL